jgi:hypothetical protein
VLHGAGASFHLNRNLSARCSGRSAWEAPLHREAVAAAGVGAAGHDAQVGARLLERVRLDVGLGGGILGSRSMIYIKFSRRG